MGLGGRGGKSKPKRGGGKRFTPARVLRDEGDVWNQPREKPEDATSDSEAASGSEEEEEEESSADEQQQQEPYPAHAADPKLGNTQADQEKNDKKSKSNDDIANPNRSTKSHMKASELGGERELSRREKEALAKERAKAAFWKAQMEGKTEQARADLARLAIVRKQREEAARKKAEEAAGMLFLCTLLLRNEMVTALLSYVFSKGQGVGFQSGFSECWESYYFQIPWQKEITSLLLL